MAISKAAIGCTFLFVYMFGLSLSLFGTLPDTVPLQFSLSGDPGNYQPKIIAALVLPVIYLIVLLAVRWLVKISPAQYAMPNSQTALTTILFGVGLVIAFSHTAILLFAEDAGIQAQTISIGIALFLIVVGNVWGKTERNFFLGLRVPWTIASEMNWKATHRLAGKLMVVAGSALIVISLLSQSMIPAIALSVVTVLVPVFYSYWYFKNRESENSHKGEPNS